MTEIKLNLDNLSDEERERFFELIEKANKPKTSRRKPSCNEMCYCIISDAKVVPFAWDDDESDKRRLAIGNVFKTEDEAYFALEKRKVEVLLQDIADELNEGWKPDWSDVSSTKYSIFYKTADKRFVCAGSIWNKHDCVYFKSEEIAKEAIRRVGEDKLKKYIFEVE